MYEPVRIRNMRGGREKWIPGTVTKILGPLTYIVRFPGNNRRMVHMEHMISRDDMLSGSPVPSPDSFSSGELLPANAVPVLDKTSVPDEPWWFKLLLDAVNHKRTPPWLLKALQRKMHQPVTCLFHDQAEFRSLS
ncbi:hypothetical protein LSH36_119g06037 [Paralvinella palmiformis]|uniref:Uncharacterized protein n=1 Tax=Paralvinella palmiformis TaxID=53620 RepID=A0AAD9JY62_9ANNE|nr:hypothetical protein LSH36_119g06037 [Paralvinella palmiformis]